MSCRGVAVVLLKGLFWGAGRKKGKGRYGDGDWCKSGANHTYMRPGCLGKVESKTLVSGLLWKAMSRHCLRDRWKCFQKKHL